MALRSRMAFSNARRVRIFDSRTSLRAICTINRPLSCAMRRRCASTAGAVPLKGNATPIASMRQAIVEALPMVMHVPGVRDMPDSAAMNSLKDNLPARTSSLNFQTSVPEPMSRPRNLPFNIGPIAQSRVTGSELGPGVADSNDRPAVEGILGQPLALHPAAVDEAILV